METDRLAALPVEQRRDVVASAGPGDGQVVACRVGRLVAEVELREVSELADDLVVALITLESGATMKVAANFGCVHPHFHDVKVFGDSATFINGLEQATLWTPGEDGPRAELLDSPYPGAEKGALVPSFIEAAAGGPAPIVTADEVFTVLATCFAIDRAAESGQGVEVETFG